MLNNFSPVKIEETSYIEPKYEMTEGDENNEEETLHFIVEGDQIIADGNSQEVSEYSENDHGTYNMDYFLLNLLFLLFCK